MIRVTVIYAWPRRFESVALTLPDGATVGDALIAGGLVHAEPDRTEPDTGIADCAVFGVRVGHGDVLRDGDRLELLRPLQIDPKDARRRRAQKK